MRILDFIGGLLVAGVLGVGVYRTMIWLLTKSEPKKTTDGDSK